MKGLTKFAASILVLLVALFGIFLTSGRAFAAEAEEESGSEEEEVWTNPFINGEKVEVAAHRSGRNIAPENTLAAFERAAQANESGEFTVDIFEFDLRMTKDEQLILLHDDTLNRTTDIEQVYPGKLLYYPIDYTYEELRALNAAMDYKNEEGKRPYRNLHGADVPENFKIPRFEEVAAFLKQRREESGIPYRFIIEIKDEGELGKKATDMLYDTLVRYDFLDSTVVGTFHNEISEYFSTKEGLMRSAGVKEVAQFLISYLKKEDLSGKNLPYIALQIPLRLWWAQLPWVHTPEFVEYAHANGIAVQYWTINRVADMDKLIYNDADAIITDSPDVLSERFEYIIEEPAPDITLWLFLAMIAVILVGIVLAIVFGVRGAKRAKLKKSKHVVA